MRQRTGSALQIAGSGTSLLAAASAFGLHAALIFLGLYISLRPPGVSTNVVTIDVDIGAIGNTAETPAKMSSHATREAAAPASLLTERDGVDSALGDISTIYGRKTPLAEPAVADPDGTIPAFPENPRRPEYVEGIGGATVAEYTGARPLQRPPLPPPSRQPDNDSSRRLAEPVRERELAATIHSPDKLEKPEEPPIGGGSGNEGRHSETTRPEPLVIRPIISPLPEYPARARRRNIEGTVILNVTIDMSGRPLAVDVQESSGNDELDRAARKSLLAWRFAPVGQTAKVHIPIEFRLDN